MPVTIRDLNDAKMLGRARYARFKREFSQEWLAPLTEAALAVHWQGVDPRVKEELTKIIPEVAKEHDRLYGGFEDGDT